MPRGKKKGSAFVCPRCGTRVSEPEKTWTLVSPIPDKKGRITVTIMGAFVCPNCGYRWRAVINKIKTGGGAEEPEEPEARQGEVIEIDLDEIYREVGGGSG